MNKLFSTLLALSFISIFLSCEEYNTYPQDPWSRPNDCRYGNCYPNNYDRYGYPPNNYPYNYDRYPRYDHHNHHNNKPRDSYDGFKNNSYPRPVNTPPPVPPREEVIRPSCPSGTSFDGRHCIINDKSKVRPGGKGTVNACPKGMWLSGDRCVRN